MKLMVSLFVLLMLGLAFGCSRSSTPDDPCKDKTCPPGQVCKSDHPGGCYTPKPSPIKRSPSPSLQDPCQQKWCPSRAVCRIAYGRVCKRERRRDKKGPGPKPRPKCHWRLKPTCMNARSSRRIDQACADNRKSVIRWSSRVHWQSMACDERGQCPKGAHCYTASREEGGQPYCCPGAQPESTVTLPGPPNKTPGVQVTVVQKDSPKCPSPVISNVSPTYCSDRCNSDSDCAGEQLCCADGCGKMCMRPYVDFHDLCKDKDCAQWEVCRHAKVCSGRSTGCVMQAVCLASPVPSDYARPPYYEHSTICQAGRPLIHRFGHGWRELNCYQTIPCPFGTVCSTSVHYAPSVCCQPDPVPTSERVTPPSYGYFRTHRCEDGQAVRVAKLWNVHTKRWELTPLCVEAALSRKLTFDPLCPPGDTVVERRPPSWHMLGCSRDFDCPTGSTCRSELADAPSVCCLNSSANDLQPSEVVPYTR